jgi:hypothetical protein
MADRWIDDRGARWIVRRGVVPRSNFTMWLWRVGILSGVFGAAFAAALVWSWRDVLWEPAIVLPAIAIAAIYYARQTVRAPADVELDFAHGFVVAGPDVVPLADFDAVMLTRAEHAAGVSTGHGTLTFRQQLWEVALRRGFGGPLAIASSADGGAMRDVARALAERLGAPFVDATRR